MKSSSNSDGSYTMRSVSHHRLRNKFNDTQPAQRSVSLESNPRKMKMLLSCHLKNVFKKKAHKNSTSKQAESLNTNITVVSTTTEEDSVIGKTGDPASIKSHCKPSEVEVDDSHDNLMKLIQEKYYQNNIINQEKNAQSLTSNTHPREIKLPNSSQEIDKLRAENAELERKNELLTIKQTNLELILKNDQELPKLRKKYKKLLNNYNQTKYKVTNLEEMIQEYQRENLELNEAKLKLEELNKVLSRENKMLKELKNAMHENDKLKLESK